VKNLHLYLSLLFVLTCAKEDSQDPNTPPSGITKQYTLTVSSGEGGSVSTAGGSFSNGTQVTITATPDEGFSFVGWSNGSNEESVTLEINNDTSILATFRKIIYNIMVEDVISPFLDNNEINFGDNYNLNQYDKALWSNYSYWYNDQEIAPLNDYSMGHSYLTKDFNNDGYDDIIILPTSPFIVDKGGSGWIVMSDGTQDVTNWTKVNLPTPIYPNNTKLNHIKSFDFSNDGYMDIVIASTRHEPYYRGAGIQLIRNDNGNDFVDVTNSNIADQSRFDQWSGEGTLILKDVNNDNKTDIIHLTSNTSDGPPNEHHGTNIYINNNGYFDIYDTDNQLPSINWTQFSGYGQFTNLPDLFYLVDQAFPININNDSKIDFISLKSVKQNDASPSPSKHVFYSIISKQ
jgi:hypothetical protein